MYRNKALFLFLFAALSSFKVFCQFEVNYIPMDSLLFDKEQFTQSMKANLTHLKKTLPRDVRSDILDVYERKSKILLSLIESNYFLSDKELNSLINEVFKEITNKNPREGYPERLLISRSPSVNAQCWGEGTMIIHLGLLNRIKTSDELAFVMAHEISHQLLDHVNLRLKGSIERWNDKNLYRKAKESGKLTVLKELAYEGSRYTRQYEKQADSLAIVLLKNTKYNWGQYTQILSMLDSAEYPKYRKMPDLASSYNFSRYPFKEQWLVKPKSAFGQGGSQSFIFDTDSIKSHPDVELRIEYLKTLFGPGEELKFSTMQLSDELQQRIDLEMVQSTYKLENYGMAMFYALQMSEKYPDNTFLNSLLAKMWYELYMARKEHFFSRYVMLSNYYPPLMEQMHIFLNNLRLTEIASITFNFLNRDKVFDKNKEDHYEMLYRISEGLKLTDVKDKLVMAYQEKFPNGVKLPPQE